MAKGKSTWKYNKLLTARRNYFSTGGEQEKLPSYEYLKNTLPAPGSLTSIKPIPKPTDIIKTPTSQKPSGGGGNNGGGLSGLFSSLSSVGGLANAAAGALGGVAGKALSMGLSSGAGNAISGIGDAVGGIPMIGGFAKGILNVVGGGVNALIGSKLNSENIAAVEGATSRANNVTASAQSFDSLSDQMSTLADVSGFNKGFIGRDGLFANKAGKKFKALQEEANMANERQALTMTTNAQNITEDTMNNLAANYSAFGGPLGFTGGAIDYGFMTDYLNTKRLAAQGQNNSMASLPNSFARGGGMTHGADFTNGLLSIDNGGSHESNPFEGVPMGVDQEGTPNLVEEGETIFNDYVFSRRLVVPKAIREKYKLRGSKDLSFAEASKQLAKESEERPNDPISERGMQALMADLANAQEELKIKRGVLETQEANRFDWGGNTLNTYGYDSNYNAGNWMVDGRYTDDYITRLGNMKLEDWNQHLKDQKAFWENSDNKGTARWNVINEMYKANPWMKNYTAKEEDIRKMVTLAKSKPGFMHPIDVLQRQLEAEKAPRNSEERRWLLGPDTDANGTPLDPYATATIIKDYDPNNAAYNYVSQRAIAEGDTDFTDYYYRQAAPTTSGATGARQHFIRLQNTDGTYGDAILFDEAKQKGLLNGYTPGSTGKEGDDDLTYYDLEEQLKGGKYADWLRYAPAVGFGIGALTDAIGLTNRPDYSNADAVLEATRGAGTYQPVGFNPIGNYLKYSPFDRDFYINKLNAEAGATRRAILQNAGLNRGAGMAAILAADANAQNSLGQLARQAEEYNLAQRNQVEDFNRGTNITNSQGMLQADIANQKAQADLRDFTLKGTMAAAQMREQARMASDAAKSANLSGLFQTLGDIGFEEKNAKMMDNLIRHGYVPGGEDFRWRRAKGGSIKRRKKGLTF